MKVTRSTFSYCLALVFALFSPDALACTIVSGVDQDGVAWAGNNEDMFFHFDTSLKVLPRGEGRLGAVVVTYSDGFPQGGVNEKGLFYDFNALQPVPREEYLDWDAKIDPPEGVNIIIEMLQRFDNVPDAIAYITQYRHTGMLAAQMHIADAAGNLAVVAGDGICYEKGYQVSTNFRVCVGDVEEKLAGKDACWRYPIADKLLKAGVSAASIKKSLAGTAQTEYVSTIYSFVTNLETTETDLYYGSDFANSYRFNVKELVGKGAASWLMRDLFPDAPLVKLWTEYKSSGVEAALRYFREETTDMSSFYRQEILRHAYTNLLLDIDPGSLDFSGAEKFFNEWMKGERNGTETYYQGIFALTGGKRDEAKKIYAGIVAKDPESNRAKSAQRVIDRIDGKKVADANVHLKLEGYRDAKFVYVNGLSKAAQFFDFMTPTETGWAGDFNALYPDGPYEFVVDGIVVKPADEPRSR